MAIQNNGLTFFPLYWVFHDQWKYHVNSPTYQEWLHWGHIHFWMMGYTPTSGSGGDAFAGTQNFSFSLEEVWGPNSGDINQALPYTIIGKPKWFFRVQEIWRRIYVQPWDEGIKGGNLAQRGIKYDACAANELMGPFREGLAYRSDLNQEMSYVPYWMQGCRSLPIEYFHDEAHSPSLRDNLVAARAEQLLTSNNEVYDPNRWCIPLDNNVLKGSPGGFAPYSDELYIWPVIEYQNVLQLDWEVLPGKPADVPPDQADETYGDGYEQSVAIPFIDPTTGHYRSPFATVPQQVLDFGKYNEMNIGPGGSRQLVPTANRPTYATVSYDGLTPQTTHSSILQEPAADSGMPLTGWHNPWRGSDGGYIVQQCLGGIVQARAQVVYQHRLGGRGVFVTTPIEYSTQTPFEGMDQDMPT
jgi:hypothetical protein